MAAPRTTVENVIKGVDRDRWITEFPRQVGFLGACIVMERNHPFMNQLGVATKDEKNTWVDSCKECSKSISEIMVKATGLVGGEKLDVGSRKILHKGLRHLPRIRDEEHAAEEILAANGRRHVDGARTIHCLGDSEKRRSGCKKAKIWKMVQSSSTKAENLENDFDELATTIWEMGWGDDKKKSRIWVEKEEKRSRR